MEAQSFIICSLNDSYYGIDASAVQEIFFLPEVTPVAEVPQDIVGLLNLRGEILPVMDLHLRLGQQAQDYHLLDSIIILKWQEIHIGIIVNQVHEVQTISTSEIKTNLSYGRDIPSGLNLQRNGSAANFIVGVTQVGEHLVMLLNHVSLIAYSQVVKEETITDDLNKFNIISANRVFCPNATPEERAVFRERAENLRHRAESEDVTGQIPLAVIGLNGEFFGLDLDAVREFTDIGKITPVPCCPDHIVGNINLRGEIVTLVDIRGLLNLPITGAITASKAMVVRLNDLVAGVTVDHVFDVMYLNPLQMMPLPAAVHSVNDEYLRGTAPYGERMMSILDLPKILTKGGLTVDEEV